MKPAKNNFSNDAPTSLPSSLHYLKQTSSNLLLLSVEVQGKEYHMYLFAKTYILLAVSVFLPSLWKQHPFLQLLLLIPPIISKTKSFQVALLLFLVSRPDSTPCIPVITLSFCLKIVLFLFWCLPPGYIYRVLISLLSLCFVCLHNARNVFSISAKQNFLLNLKERDIYYLVQLGHALAIFILK